MVAGGRFAQVASAAAPTTAIPRSNIFAGTFKTANGVARTAFAAVDPVTGALSNDVNLAFTGPRNGTVNIDKFDITPDGTRLIAIGNWTMWPGSSATRSSCSTSAPAR